MKKILAAVLLCCMVLTMLTGCIGVKKIDETSKETVENEQGNDVTKEDLEEAVDTMEDAGVTLDPDLEDMLEDVDQADIDAAAAANAELKVTADLPEGWEQDTKASVAFSATKDLNMVMVTKSYIPDGVNDANGVAEDAIKQIKEFFEDAEYSAVESKNMAGYDGASFYIDISITENMVQRQEYFYFIKGSDAIMVQGAYMADDEAAAAEVQKVMDSIKLG